MTDLILSFAPYAIAIVGLVTFVFGVLYLAWRWNKPDPRPGYVSTSFYDREKL